jgi:hypothetical protein
VNPTSAAFQKLDGDLIVSHRLAVLASENSVSELAGQLGVGRKDRRWRPSGPHDVDMRPNVLEAGGESPHAKVGEEMGSPSLLLPQPGKCHLAVLVLQHGQRPRSPACTLAGQLPHEPPHRGSIAGDGRLADLTRPLGNPSSEVSFAAGGGKLGPGCQRPACNVDVERKGSLLPAALDLPDVA